MMGSLAEELELEGARSQAHDLGLEGAEPPAPAPHGRTLLAPPPDFISYRAPDQAPIPAGSEFSGGGDMGAVAIPWSPKEGVSFEESAARGGGQGFTFGLGEEGAAALTPIENDETGILREYANGDTARGSMLRQYRRDNAEAQAANPATYGVSEALGATPALTAAGAATGGGGLAARVAKGAAAGGATGAVSGLGHSEAETAGGLARDAAAPAAVGALLGGGAPLVGAGAQWAGGKVRQGADYLRGIAAGGRSLPVGEDVAAYGRSVNEAGLPVGEDVAAYGRSVNEAGLPRAMPRTVGGYRKAAKAGADVVGAELGAARDAATARGEGVPVGKVQDDLTSLYEEYAGLNLDTGDKQARVIAKELGRVQNQFGAPLPSPAESPPGQRLITELEARYARTAARPGNDAAAAEIQRAIERVKAGDFSAVPQHLRNGAYDAATVAPTGPEAQMSVRALADRASGLRGPTEGGYPARNAVRTTNTDTTEARKLAKRAAAGVYSDLEDYAAGPGIVGMKQKFGTLAGIQRNAAAQMKPSRLPMTMTQGVTDLAANYGADTAAKLGYAAAAPLSAVGRAASAVAPMAPAAGAAAGAWEHYSTAPITPEEQRNRGRGQMLPDAAERLYHEDPSAFGPYARDIFEALKGGDGKLASTLSRLEQDPQFAQSVLPKLRSMTEGKAQ